MGTVVYGVNRDGEPTSWNSPDNEADVFCDDIEDRDHKAWVYVPYPAGMKRPAATAPSACSMQPSGLYRFVIEQFEAGRANPNRSHDDILFEIQEWADSEGLILREVDCRAYRVKGFVIVQEWIADLERKHPGELAQRAWDAWHHKPPEGSDT